MGKERKTGFNMDTENINSNTDKNPEH